jgi:Flp pilus assembly pilin Flp
LCGDHSGASAVEHALLVCVVALVIVFAVAKGFSPRNFIAILQSIAESDQRNVRALPEGR